jgi:uncharacterized protein (TIGR03435 family)
VPYRVLLVSLAISIMPITFGQTPPAFEVASIKLAPSLEEMVRSRQMHLGVNVDPAFADIGSFSLTDLVGYAFRLRPFQISGPEWLNGQRFDIRAKLPDGATVDQVPEMVQRLLVERFHLTFHIENKEFPAYALLVGPKGPKLTVCPPDYERPAHGDVIPMTLGRYAEAISALFDRPVIDRTELPGTYLLSVRPVGRGLTERYAARAKTLTQTDTAPEASASEPAGSAMSATLADLGLRVEARKLPLPFLVVDRVEKQPTEQ